MPAARKEKALVLEELQIQITSAQEHLAAALEAGETYDAARHRARLRDLIDLATRHGVDVHTLIDPTLLDS